MTEPEQASNSSLAIMSILVLDADSERRRETLAHLKVCCEMLIGRGRPFGLADVQRTVQERFGKHAGPKAQSISNERKRPLGMYHYVAACMREVGNPSLGGKAKTRKGGPPVLAAIDRIDDVDIRSAMLDLHERAEVAVRTLSRAKLLLKVVRPGTNIDALLSGGIGAGAPEVQDVPIECVEALERLVEILTSDEKLAQVGLSYDGRRVKRRTGTRDELIGPMVLVGLQKLLEVLLTPAGSERRLKGV